MHSGCTGVHVCPLRAPCAPWPAVPAASVMGGGRRWERGSLLQRWAVWGHPPLSKISRGGTGAAPVSHDQDFSMPTFLFTFEFYAILSETRCFIFFQRFVLNLLCSFLASPDIAIGGRKWTKEGFFFPHIGVRSSLFLKIPCAFFIFMHCE